MSREAGLAILLGALSGASLVLLGTGSFGAVILSYLSPLPLFFVALTCGVPKAVLAVIVGGVEVSLLGPGTLLFYLVAAAFPVLLLSRQALFFRAAPEAGTDGAGAAVEKPGMAAPSMAGDVEWYPPGLLATWLAGMAAAAYLAASLWYAGAPGGVGGLFVSDLTEVMKGLAAPGSGADVAKAAARMAPLVPAILAVLWQVIVAANGALAQGLAHRFGRNLRPAPDIARLELPPQLALVLAAAVVLSVLLPARGVTETLALILAVPFFFQGLGVVHAMLRRSPIKGPLLAVFYLLLMVAGVLTVLVAALGLVEQWAHLRRRGQGGLGSGN